MMALLEEVSPTITTGTMAPGICNSHMPRPWVAMRRVRLGLWMARSNTATRGRPLPTGPQLAPASLDP